MRRPKPPTDIEEDQNLDQSIAERLSKILATLNNMEED